MPAFDLIAQVLKAGYVDAFDRGGTGQRMTWPSAQPERRIDYIFSSSALADALTNCACWYDPPVPTASDHLPVLAEFA